MGGAEPGRVGRPLRVTVRARWPRSVTRALRASLIRSPVRTSSRPPWVRGGEGPGEGLGGGPGVGVGAHAAPCLAEGAGDLGEEVLPARTPTASCASILTKSADLGHHTHAGPRPDSHSARQPPTPDPALAHLAETLDHALLGLFETALTRIAHGGSVARWAALTMVRLR